MAQRSQVQLGGVKLLQKQGLADSIEGSSLPKEERCLIYEPSVYESPQIGKSQPPASHLGFHPQLQNTQSTSL